LMTISRNSAAQSVAWPTQAELALVVHGQNYLFSLTKLLKAQ